MFFPRVGKIKRTVQLAFGFFKRILIFKSPDQTMCASSGKVFAAKLMAELIVTLATIMSFTRAEARTDAEVWFVCIITWLVVAGFQFSRELLAGGQTTGGKAERRLLRMQHAAAALRSSAWNNNSNTKAVLHLKT